MGKLSQAHQRQFPPFLYLLRFFKLKQESRDMCRANITSPLCLIQCRCEAEQDRIIFLETSARARVQGSHCVYIVLPLSISSPLSRSLSHIHCASIFPPPTPPHPPTHTLLSASERGTVSPLLHGLSLTCFSFPFYYSTHCPFVASPPQSYMTNICIALSVQRQKSFLSETR